MKDTTPKPRYNADAGVQISRTALIPKARYVGSKKKRVNSNKTGVRLTINGLCENNYL